jgi:hypothetical protein
MKNMMTLVFAFLLIVGIQSESPAISLLDLQDVTNVGGAGMIEAFAQPSGGITNPANVTIAGAANALGTFTNGFQAFLGINQGIILSTGDIIHAASLGNRNPSMSMNNFAAGDATLDFFIAPGVTRDAAVMEFDFTPARKIVTVPFVFASDEFPIAGINTFDDIFGVFVDGAVITLGNVNTLTSNGLVFVTDDLIIPFLPTPFDGITGLLNAQAAVTPGVPHHIKLAIADVGPATAPDGSVDSSVFLSPVVSTSFFDTPNHLGREFVEQIFAAGITGGCAPDFFCPDSSITRAQMAVFIETSLGVTTAPACTGSRFTDVNAATVGEAFCGFIEDVATRGITGGCTPTQFCPNDPVTRAQMAVFIEAALGNPANPCGTRFTDVTAGTVGAAVCGFIDRLAADGITGGCGPGLFCPNNSVTRGQMAIFLVAAPPPLSP